MTILNSPVVFPGLADDERLQRKAQRATWTLGLTRGCTAAIRLNRDETARIQCKAGLFWVTIEGDVIDYAVVAGESVTFSQTGLIVIEGLEPMNEAALLLGGCSD